MPVQQPHRGYEVHTVFLYWVWCFLFSVTSHPVVTWTKLWIHRMYQIIVLMYVSSFLIRCSTITTLLNSLILIDLPNCLSVSLPICLFVCLPFYVFHACCTAFSVPHFGLIQTLFCLLPPIPWLCLASPLIILRLITTFSSINHPHTNFNFCAENQDEMFLQQIGIHLQEYLVTKCRRS
jgi:hypothetical protein